MARRKAQPAAKASATLPQLPQNAEERAQALQSLAAEIVVQYGSQAALAPSSWIGKPRSSKAPG
jgi:hypothetical protein